MDGAGGNNYPEILSEISLAERGTWVAQSVECPTLSLGSGHGLRVERSSPAWAPHSVWGQLVLSLIHI